MAPCWSTQNKWHQLLTNTIVATSVDEIQLLQVHRQLMNTEDVVREAANRCTQVETSIMDQWRIKDTATLTMDNLENCLQTIKAAEASAAINHAESQNTFKAQLTAIYALRKFSVTMLGVYMQQHNFDGVRVQ